MTDTEIIKALECCTTKGAKCSDCPAFKKVDRSDCKKYFRGAIDLINRQKAEIERLKADNKTLENVIKNNFLEKAGLDIDPLAEIRAESIKEFAIALRQQAFDRLYVSIDEINNLVKEMVGEQE